MVHNGSEGANKIIEIREKPAQQRHLFYLFTQNSSRCDFRSCSGIKLLTKLWHPTGLAANDDRKTVYGRRVWKQDWMIAPVWRSELQRWPSNRVTDSTCCLADLWATYQSHTRWTAAPWVTGLHLPASHSITADSARGSMGRGHVGGRNQVHGLTLPSDGACVCGEVRGHVDISNDWLDARWDSAAIIKM